MHRILLQNVQPNSPASVAGLVSDSDYIVGTDGPHVELPELLQIHNMKPLHLHVYSTLTNACREVMVTPNDAWGGEGRWVIGGECAEKYGKIGIGGGKRDKDKEESFRYLDEG